MIIIEFLAMAVLETVMSSDMCDHESFEDIFEQHLEFTKQDTSGGGPKKWRFQWNKEAEELLLSVSKDFDRSSMTYSEYVNSVSQKFKSLLKRRGPTNEAIRTKLDKLLQPTVKDPDAPKQFRWPIGVQLRLLAIGIKWQGRQEREKERSGLMIPYVAPMYEEFKREFPDFEGTSEWLRKMFNKIFKEQQKKNSKEVQAIIKEVEDDLTKEDLAKAVNIEDNLPNNLDNIKRMWRIGYVHGEEPMFKGLCCICAKLLFGDSRINGRWKKINRFDKKFSSHAFSQSEFVFPIEEHFNAEDIPQQADLPYKTDNNEIYTCRVCFQLSAKGKCITDYIDVLNPETHKMDLPPVLKNITTDLERGLIGLLAVYHNINIRQKEYLRHFLHLRGEVNLARKVDQAYLYMYGLIVGRPCEARKKNIRQQHENARKALRWLIRNNIHFRSFYANCQTLFGKLKGGSILEMIQPGEIETTKGSDIIDELDRERIGYVIPSENYTGDKDIEGDDFNPHICHPKTDDTVSDLRKQTRVTLFDKRLEAMAFPCDFPSGRGSYDPDWKHISHRNYIKFLLLNLDRRFRQNNVLPFFLIDRYIKISMVNHARMYVAADSDRAMEKPTAKEFIDPRSEAYKKYGTAVAANIPGSKSFWWLGQQEILAIANEMKREPDFFYTVTTSDSWPEVQSLIKHGPGFKCDQCPHRPKPKEADSATDYPIFSSISFHQRFQLWMTHVINNPSGELGKVERHWYRREYQKRGAVHIHGVVWIEEGTKRANVVKAEMPRTTSKNETDIEFVEKLRGLVKDLQTHDHYPERCFIRGNEALPHCKYNFPAPLVNEARKDDSGLRVLYKRRKEEDRFIVPYCWSLLLIFRSCCNIQEVNGEYWKIYLAKYISKPESSVKLPIFGGQTFSKNATWNEKYLKMRIMGAVEIADISLQFPLKVSNVEVIFLDIPLDVKRKTLKRKEHMPKDEDSEDVFYQSKFEKYLHRPNVGILHYVTYPDFWRRFTYDRKSLQAINDYDKGDGEECEDQSQPDVHTDPKLELTDSRHRKIRPRRKPAVIYFPFVLPYGDDQEKYCLKLILESVPLRPEDWDDFLTKNQCKSYFEYCIKNNLWNDANIGEQFLETAKNQGLTEYDLRRIAGELIAGNFLSNPQFQSFFESHQLAHLLENDKLDEGQLIEGIDPDPDFGEFPCPNVDLLPLEDYIKDFTEDQRKVFDYIREQISRNEQVLLNIVGPAGTGKSFLIKALCALFKDKTEESTYKSFSILAPTGSAAHQLGGQTCHSKFRFDTKYKSHIQPNTIESWLVRYCDVFLIDEISMIDEMMMEEMERNIRINCKLCDKGKEFGGKHIILFGDPAQLPSRYAPWFNGQFFKLFKNFTMKEIVRQSGDAEFARMLQYVRVGNVTPEVNNYFKSKVVKDIERVKQSAFEKNITIIVSLRAQVDQFNNDILAKSKEQEFSFEAIDTDMSGHKLSELSLKRLKEKDEKMENVLKIKKNALVFIRRNINVAKGLVNGRQAIVDSIHPDSNYIILRSLDGKEFFPIRRMKQTIDDYGENRYIRQQFPISLGWAATVHRVQGKTLDKVYVSVDEKMFASGQAYVALTRTRRASDMRLIAFDKTKIFIKLYYQELLKWIENNDFLLPEDQREPNYPFPQWKYDDKFIDPRSKDEEEEGEAEEAEEPTSSQKMADVFKDFKISSQSKDKPKHETKVTPKPTSKPQPRPQPQPLPHPGTSFVSAIIPRITVPTTGSTLSRVQEVIRQLFRFNHFRDNDTIRQTFSQIDLFNFGVYVLNEVRQKEILSINGPTHHQSIPIKNGVRDYHEPFIPPNIANEFHQYDVAHDGNCFYYSISVLLYGQQAYEQIIRFAALFCVSQQMERWDLHQGALFRNACDLCLSIAVSVRFEGIKEKVFNDTYKERFRRDDNPLGTLDFQFNWAENAAVLAVSEAIDRPIDICWVMGKHNVVTRYSPRSQNNRRSVVMSLDFQHRLYNCLIPNSDTSFSYVEHDGNPQIHDDIWYPFDTENLIPPINYSGSTQIDPTYADNRPLSGLPSPSEMDTSEHTSQKRSHPSTSSSSSDTTESRFQILTDLDSECADALTKLLISSVLLEESKSSVDDFIKKFYPTLTKRVKDTLNTANIKTIHDLPPSIRRFQGQQWLQRHVQLNYKAVDVVGDGSCWYRAVSMCLFATERHYHIIRFGALAAVLRFWDGYFAPLSNIFALPPAPLCFSIATSSPFPNIEKVYEKFIKGDNNLRPNTFHWADLPHQIATSIVVNRPIDLWIKPDSIGRGGRICSKKYPVSVRPIVIQMVGESGSTHFQALIPIRSDTNSCQTRLGNPCLSSRQLNQRFYLLPIGRDSDDDRINDSFRGRYPNVHFILQE